MGTGDKARGGSMSRSCVSTNFCLRKSVLNDPVETAPKSPERGWCVRGGGGGGLEVAAPPGAPIGEGPPTGAAAGETPDGASLAAALGVLAARFSGDIVSSSNAATSRRASTSFFSSRRSWRRRIDSSLSFCNFERTRAPSSSSDDKASKYWAEATGPVAAVGEEAPPGLSNILLDVTVGRPQQWVRDPLGGRDPENFHVGAEKETAAGLTVGSTSRVSTAAVRIEAHYLIPNGHSLRNLTG